MDRKQLPLIDYVGLELNEIIKKQTVSLLGDLFPVFTTLTDTGYQRFVEFNGKFAPMTNTPSVQNPIPVSAGVDEVKARQYFTTRNFMRKSYSAIQLDNINGADMTRHYAFMDQVVNSIMQARYRLLDETILAAIEREVALYSMKTDNSTGTTSEKVSLDVDKNYIPTNLVRYAFGDNNVLTLLGLSIDKIDEVGFRLGKVYDYSPKIVIMNRMTFSTFINNPKNQEFKLAWNRSDMQVNPSLYPDYEGFRFNAYNCLFVITEMIPVLDGVGDNTDYDAPVAGNTPPGATFNYTLPGAAAATNFNNVKYSKVYILTPSALTRVSTQYSAENMWPSTMNEIVVGNIMKFAMGYHADSCVFDVIAQTMDGAVRTDEDRVYVTYAIVDANKA
jgi:hypothetical protein